ncbi:Glycerophosphoryl diester phosphodiesterase family-domain-containing protein [Xylaria sp. FL1042]|nr:Glycerophosphoryl diester phosphodiesterase family-domain-containing protein [Xylaria sp. FL1042]
MRFGQNFHSYTVPEWDGFYIQYDVLKQLIKSPPVSDDVAASTNHVKQRLLEAFSRLQSSEITLYLSLTRRHDVLFSSHLGMQPGPTSADRSLLRTYFESSVLHYIQATIFDLQGDLQRLQWFERVNHEAVDHIFAKLHKSLSYRGVETEAMLSEWHQMQEAVFRVRIHVRKLIQEASNCCRCLEEELATSLSVAAGQTRPSYILGSALVEAITHGSANALEAYLQHNQGIQPDFQRDLFKGFALQHNWQCLMILASRFASSLDHHCLAVLFRSPQISSHHPPVDSVFGSLAHDFEWLSRVLRELINNAPDTIARSLCQVDAMGHSPLHYAMKSGFDISTIIHNALGERLWHSFLPIAMLSKDKQGLTPLHFATAEGHTSVIISFLDKLLPLNLQAGQSHEINGVAAACLQMAIKLGNDILVKKLSGWADTKYTSAQEQSTLHLTARVGRCDYIMMLIDACGSENLNLDIFDSRGRTPLMDAAARGHISVAKLLLKVGANPSLMDSAAWTARKYAAHRGHLELAELLPKPSNTPARHLMGSSDSLNTALAIPNSDSQKHTLVIYLGSMQLMDNRSPVRLVATSDDLFSSQSAPKLHRLEFSVSQRDKQSQTITLPFLEEQSSKPLIFHLDAATEPQLLARLFKDDPIDESSCPLLAAGAVFLHASKSLYGHQRESLVREHTIILLGTDSQDIFGTVLLTYIIVRPIGHLQSQIPMTSPTSLKNDQMTLVGHRGFGQNVASSSHLQLGENTIGSFIMAANHGAAFVEFDAQVTRDLETVIYHDFSLSETGTDIPIHDLTIDQYKYASSVQTPHGNPLTAPDQQTIICKDVAVRRSRSIDGQTDLGALLIRDRLKHTVDFKSKSMKPNIRGHVIQEPLVILSELFQKLPPSLGFNIEIKYPRLHEARDAGVAPIALEINLFVDTVLEQLHRFADKRAIILSSFTPEICILLSIKQKAYPILFITNAGKLPTNDFERRVASVQAGVQFAKTWGLAGLCLASEPLMLCPELIGDIKRSGLICASYGPQNSIPGNVLVQRNSGLDMIMVDNVALIAKSLQVSNYGK